MKFTTPLLASLLATQAAAARDKRAHSVLRFINGNGKWLTDDMADPIVNPGVRASHHHGIQGGSAFSLNNTGAELMSSQCTTAQIKNDHSNYWVPSLWFQHPQTGKFALVPMFYMNVYYFNEATDDEIQPFPVGLKMLSGDANLRTAPPTGDINLDPSKGPIQPVQFTCPRYDTSPPMYPPGSDGSKAGIQDSQNKGAGAGLPVIKCSVPGAPLRQDIHFPSCYKPSVGLNDYKNNMEYPTYKGGKQNCCKDCIHTPHIFFEVYWDTPQFDGLWTEDGVNQPFLLSNGDKTGFSSHGDFHAAWDLNTLKTIIDTCDAANNKGNGMNECPNIPGGLNTEKSCSIAPPTGDQPYKPSNKNSIVWYDTLPGNVPVTGFGSGNVQQPPAGGSSSSSSANNAASTRASSAAYTSPTGNPGAFPTSASGSVSAKASATATGTKGQGDNKPTGRPTGRPPCRGAQRRAAEPVAAPEPTQPVARHAHEHLVAHQARHRYDRR